MIIDLVVWTVFTVGAITIVGCVLLVGFGVIKLIMKYNKEV